MFSVKSSVTAQKCGDREWTMTHHSITLKNLIQRWQYLPLDGSSIVLVAQFRVTGSLQ